MKNTAVTEYNISFKEFCQKLSISQATGKNWLRLGKLKDYKKENKHFYFNENYVEKLQSDILSGKNTALKSRRNKKYISGNKLYYEYLSKNSKNIKSVENIVYEVNTKIETDISDELIISLLADCAIKLIIQRLNLKISSKNLLKDYLSEKFNLSGYDFLLKEFLTKINKKISDNDLINNAEYFYEEGEDVLGFLYISLSNLKNRKSKGAYYTPTNIVENLCKELFKRKTISAKTILDPCCGTGNFLLKSPFSADKIYGYDIDSIAVAISKINLALKYKINDKTFWDSHIKVCNFLNQTNNLQPDYIIGNPPWGYNFTALEKKELKKKYSTGRTVESFDLIIQQAISELNYNGILSFVLPEAFLNVKTHFLTREIILNNCNIDYIEYLGDVFSGVQCPSIIIRIKKTNKPLNTKGTKIKYKNKLFTIKTNRPITGNNFCFNITDDEFFILNKMENIKDKQTLKDKSKFALGIVTGDNKKYLSSVKTDKNEIILKGADIQKFVYNQPKQYINFNPKEFQQTAPEDLYRAKEKLVYKFISDEPVFAYDNNQVLTLNSCNILIPEIKGMDIKYILAVLNSEMAQFYFKKRFNSIKLLRSHIEEFPIPYPDKKTQTKIVSLVDKIINGEENKHTEKELNDIIKKLYGL